MVILQENVWSPCITRDCILCIQIRSRLKILSGQSVLVLPFATAADILRKSKYVFYRDLYYYKTTMNLCVLIQFIWSNYILHKTCHNMVKKAAWRIVVAVENHCDQIKFFETTLISNNSISCSIFECLLWPYFWCRSPIRILQIDDWIWCDSAQIA